MIWEDQGFDRYKCINGCKCQLLVDTQGRIWVLGVHAAGQVDGLSALELVGVLLWRGGEGVEKIFGDKAYVGVFACKLAQWSRFAGSIDYEKAFRSESARGLCL